jgi:hypothetical protein
MSLVVPAEYAKDISRHSGYLNSKSQWTKKTLKGLFRAPPNVTYLTEQLYKLVSHPQFVHDHNEVSTSIGLDIPSEEQSNYVADGVKHVNRPTLRGEPYRKTNTKPTRRDYEVAMQFKKIRAAFDEAVPPMVEEYVLPYTEDIKTHNPIMELHYVNLDFLTTTAELLIQNPLSLIDMRQWDDDTGTYQKGRDYDYSAESWSDGTWHPEHLFSKSQANKQAGYWVPREVDFWNGPIGYPGKGGDGLETEAIRQADLASASSEFPILREDMDSGETPWDVMETGGRGPGNRYKHIALPDLEALGYADDARRGDDRGLYNDTDASFAGKVNQPGGRSGRRGMFANGGQFPFWQTTMHQRPYERDNSEGLQEGGLGDRRVQMPHGYNMTDLTRKSGARNQKIPRQSHYKN